jgi:ribosomal protein S18 acetylase RimI-like enzyme
MSLITLEITGAREEHLQAIAELAGVIWREYYPSIITPEQIEYMLAKMYSIETLRAELQSGIRYHRLLINGELTGFASLDTTEAAGTFKLHKLYVLPRYHGRGAGSVLLKTCEEEARRMGARRLSLNVNKCNTKAIAAYQRNGFTIVESVVNDIGNGFVMDDYVMSKRL